MEMFDAIVGIVMMVVIGVLSVVLGLMAVYLAANAFWRKE